MRKFTFELLITERDVEGDEFWEHALERDGTGITELKEAIAEAINDHNIMIGSNRHPIEALTLKKYEVE